MLIKEDVDYIQYLLSQDCIFLEYHTRTLLEVRQSKNKMIIKDGNSLYKVKIFTRKRGKYDFKVEAKEMDAPIPTTKIFRIAAYKRHV